MNAERILKKDIKLHRIINDDIAYPDGAGAVLSDRTVKINHLKNNFYYEF